MSAFSYIVTEGVHDVAFLGRLLSIAHGAARIRKLEDLDDSHKQWLSAFKWPMKNKAHHDISRLSVPAPVFFRLATNDVIALRNAQGISGIGDTLEIDLESFARNLNGPRAIGVVLDMDDQPAAQRFEMLASALHRVNLTPPSALGEVSAGAPRVGAFALPGTGAEGTLEDILLELGETAYPELTRVARGFADHWLPHSSSEPDSSDWKEYRKPAGRKKATVGAMTAVLKPGKSVQVSLDDNRWVSEQTVGLACLQPALGFLSALLAPTPGGPE